LPLLYFYLVLQTQLIWITHLLVNIVLCFSYQCRILQNNWCRYSCEVCTWLLWHRVCTCMLYSVWLHVGGGCIRDSRCTGCTCSGVWSVLLL